MSKNQRSLKARGWFGFWNLFLQPNSKRSLFASAAPPWVPPCISFALVGVTGFEPVTLRLSSACSNQLSYTPLGWLIVERG